MDGTRLNEGMFLWYRLTMVVLDKVPLSYFKSCAVQTWLWNPVQLL